MNEQTVKLIEDLALKFNTTTEHLWGVLVKQAPITAGTTFVTTVAQFVALTWITKFLFAKIKKETNLESLSILTLLAACLCILYWGICFWAIEGAVDVIVNGFFNPEYWALKQIIK